MANSITAQEASILIQEGKALLIDVREPAEFQAEHIAHALSIPLSQLESVFQTLKIPSEKVILFQCLHGKRGEMACEATQKLKNISNQIHNIEGGIQSLKQAGLPVTAAQSSTIPIMRQVQIIVGGLVLLSVILGFLLTQATFVVAGMLGAALVFAGITGWCGGLALLMKKMPWNQP